MLIQYQPIEDINGSNKLYSLPSDYIKDLIIYVNGVMYVDTDLTFGYSIVGLTFTMDNPLSQGDTLFIIYDDGFVETGTGGGSTATGTLRLRKGYNLVSWMGKITGKWDNSTSTVVDDDTIIANVQNSIIDQVEDMYGVSADNLIREIQIYYDDTSQYFTYIPGSTGTVWKADGSHVTTPSLYELAGANDQGDPSLSDFVYYNPHNFVLASTVLNGTTLESIDVDNTNGDLGMGLRNGIHIFIKDHPALDTTSGLLEIMF
jgi:hypothetical protein